jgi:hypothetical protein
MWEAAIRLLIACFIVGGGIGTVRAVEDLDDETKAQAQRTRSFAPQARQLPVDWGDANLKRARAGFEAQPQMRSRSLKQETPLSLPRWGFSADIQKSTSEEQTRSFSAATTLSDVGWPACAKALVKREPLSDNSGSWYADDYDFNCISLTIRGDRNVDPDTRVAAQGTADCNLEQGRSVPSDSTGAIHPGDDTQGTFELEVKLNGIPYSISGTCLTPEADPFCRNRASQCALVERLIFMGGSEQ